MTGITKDELMQMASDAGFPFNKYGLLQGDEEGEIDADEMFERLANAILERAAVECDKRADVLTEHENKIQSESGFPPAWEWTRSARTTSQQCAKSIRALKINTGD